MTSERQGFEYWLDYMDDALEEFFAYLPEDVTTKLDYSIESLDVLEAWLLERYPVFDAIRQETDPLILDGAARYIGETFRKWIGGQWMVDLKDNAYDGLPYIADFDVGMLPFCPLTFATASTDRRWGDFISSILRKKIARLSKSE